ncbi:MAG: rhomboid family intramembrane serine protease [Luteitalea sp.]|nr:rhomboid family intramembrane serine protease [Luteitalea sp.]
MFKRQTSGSVVCISCGSLVGVNDDRCYTCGQRNPGLWGYAPLIRNLGRDVGFTSLVIGASVALYVISLLLSGPNIRMGDMMSFLAPSLQALYLLGASGAIPVVLGGAWWTVLSAGWLHGGLIHILFNVLWIRNLAPSTADAFGPGRMIIIYVVAGACGFFLSSMAGYFLAGMPVWFLRGSDFTVGASASIFGLLGALMCYGRRTGSSMIHREAKLYAVMLFIFGLIMPGVDNYAHAGGFIGGYVMADLLKPLEPERVTHVLVALCLLVATALAILASVIAGLRVLG